MIVTLKSPRSRFEEGGSTLLDPQFYSSHIIHGGNREYFSEWAGNLSLKTFFNGSAFYDTGKGKYAVEEGRYLLLNEAQPYSITIDSAQRVESFCIFFESGFAGEVLRAETERTDRLLDDPEPSNNDVDFVQRLYSLDGSLRRTISEFRGSLTERFDDHGWIREKLNEVMLHLLRLQFGLRTEIDQIDAVRPSTRKELYRRLHRARDFAESAFHLRISLDDMASVACMAPNHFLRTFKQLFSVTPHQFLTELRISKAKKLLNCDDLTVTDICFAIGFESVGSFSSLFRRRVGVSPLQYRQKGVFR